MWTSTLELNPRRVLLTQLLGRFWRGAYFSSFAPLQVQNLPRQPLPAPNWVRVRNRLAGICGSDLKLIYVDGDFRIAPAALPNQAISYPGHEVVGEVIEVGDEVQHLQVGDRVVLQSGPNCLSAGIQPPCRSCAAGNYNLCEYGTFPGPQPVGGGWSEEMLLHEQQLFRIPPGLSDEQAVLIEPASVALHAVLRRLPQPDGQVLIIGAGTIGLLTLQVVRALLPQARISVMIRYAFQVEQALRMGADHILYPQDSYEGIQFKTGAHLYKGLLGNKMLLGGYDVIYDTVGSRHTLHDALRWTRGSGTVVMVGLTLHMMNVDLSPIWYQEVNLIGSVAHGTETWPPGSSEHQATFAIAAQMIGEGKLHPEKLITHRFALNNYRQALTIATGKAQSRAIKVIFDYSLLPMSVVPNVRAAAQSRRLRGTRQSQFSSDQSLPVGSPGSAIEPPLAPAPTMQSSENGEFQTVAPADREESSEAGTMISSPTVDSDEDMATVVVPNPKKIQPTTPPTLETPASPPQNLEPVPEPQSTQPAQSDDENVATVVVAKPKYARKPRKTQEVQPSQEPAQDSPSPGETEQGISAATNDASDTLLETGEQLNTIDGEK